MRPAVDYRALLDELADVIALKVIERLDRASVVEPVEKHGPSEPATTKQAAAELGVSEQWLKVQRMRGTGPVFYRFGKAIRYPRDALRDFRAKRLRRNTSEEK